MTAEYKLSLPFHTIESADPKAKPALEKAKAQMGFVPNMYAGMANAPGLLDTYLESYARFRSESGFTPPEQEVVFLTISRANGCGYCVAAHSFVADQMSKVPPPVTEAIRNGHPIPEPKLAALSIFVETMVRTRGLPSNADVQVFLAAGYEERHVLQIILAIAVKTISNYADHVLHSPVDAAFAGRAWMQAA